MVKLLIAFIIALGIMFFFTAVVGCMSVDRKTYELDATDHLVLKTDTRVFVIGTEVDVGKIITDTITIEDGTANPVDTSLELKVNWLMQQFELKFGTEGATMKNRIEMERKLKSLNP